MTQAPTPGPLSGDADTLKTLLDNLVIAQSLSREIREHATDQARSYLYDIRTPPSHRSWTPWAGGPNPVTGQMVEVQHRNGNVHQAVSGAEHAFDWTHDGDETDIIAFRLAPPAPVEASGSENPAAERLRKWADGRRVYVEFPHPSATMKADIRNVLAALRPQPSGETREQCAACSRGEVTHFSTDDGFWIEITTSAGGANGHGLNGWFETLEHYPDGSTRRREYVATDSPSARPAPVASGGQHSSGEGETEVQYEVWGAGPQGDFCAGSDTLSDAQHYATVYGQDGPVVIKVATTTRVVWAEASPALKSTAA